MPRSRRPSDSTRRVLEALAATRSWTYGYDISRETEVPSGSLYPILMRLTDRGALVSRWLPPERPGRPARHGYRLTAAGLRLLEEARAETKAARQSRRGHPARG